MKRFILESPLPDGLAGQVGRLSSVVRDELIGLVPSNRRWCFGIFGERGTGKTSFLLSLLNQLEAKNSKGNPTLVLPKRPDTRFKTPYEDRDLFAPSAHRLEDDLLFLLVGYLFCRYTHRADISAVRTDIEELEVKRLEIQRFLDYEQNNSPTVKDIPRRLREARRDAATTTQRLREEFGKLLDGLRTPEKETLILPVDDLDLQPQRALEMLELLHLFLDHPGVIVLVAADGALLHAHLATGLVGRRWPRGEQLAALEKEIGPELPGALLAKYIPYHWDLPLPDERARLSYLLCETYEQNASSTSRQPVESDPVGTELGKWWGLALEKSLPTYLLLTPDRALETLIREFKHAGQTDPAASDRQQEAAKLVAELPIRSAFLAQLLPSSYRQLKAILNRLYMLRHEGAAEDGAGLYPTFGSSTNLGSSTLGAFLLALVILDVRLPEQRLLERLRRMGSTGPEWLDRLVGPEQKERTPTLPWQDGSREAEAEWLYFWLHKLWRLLKGVQDAGALQRNRLDISLNRDVYQDAHKADLPQSEAALGAGPTCWHIDLMEPLSLKPGGRANPDTLRSARRLLKQTLEERKLLAEPGELVLNMKVQLPLCLWLGWFTRYGRPANSPLGAYNFYNFVYVFYPPVERRLRPEYDIAEADLKADGSSLGWVLADTNKVGDRTQAVLAVDLLGKVPRSQAQLMNKIRVEPIIQTRPHAQGVEGFAEEEGPEASSRSTDADTLEANEKRPAHWWVLGLEESGHDLAPQVLLSWLKTVVNCVGYLRRVREVSTFHLLLSCPDVFAFFLGQQLNAFGTIKLYEHYTDGEERYEYVFDLADPQ